MNLTTKQAALLRVIIDGDPTGPVDIDQILVRLPYETTKQSLQFSLRAMVDKGCIEKAGQVSRRGRSRVTYIATPTGHALFNPGFIYGGSSAPAVSPVSEITAEEIGGPDQKLTDLDDDLGLDLTIPTLDDLGNEN